MFHKPLSTHTSPALCVPAGNVTRVNLAPAMMLLGQPMAKGEARCRWMVEHNPPCLQHPLLHVLELAHAC